MGPPAGVNIGTLADVLTERPPQAGQMHTNRTDVVRDGRENLRRTHEPLSRWAAVLVAVHRRLCVRAVDSPAAAAGRTVLRTVLHS